MLKQGLITNFKAFCKSSNKTYTRYMGLDNTFMVQDQFTVHNDNNIFDYTGPENGVWKHPEIIVGICQVDASFSGVDTNDIVPVVAIYNDGDLTTDGWYLYYPASFGIGQKRFSVQDFPLFKENHMKVFDFSYNSNMFWEADSSARTIFICFNGFNNSKTVFALQSVEGDVFYKDSNGNISFDSVEKITLVMNESYPFAYYIDATECNVINVGDSISTLRSFVFDKKTAFINSEISMLGEDVNTVSTLVDDLEERVSQIESDSVNKFVSR